MKKKKKKSNSFLSKAYTIKITIDDRNLSLSASRIDNTFMGST